MWVDNIHLSNAILVVFTGFLSEKFGKNNRLQVAFDLI
jgi:hypothetical protein